MLSEMLLKYLAVINLLAFAVYGWDKFCAKAHRWRVPEIVLLGLAALGGSVGAYAAMQIFRHKTLHWKFRVGVPVLFLLQAFAVFRYW